VELSVTGNTSTNISHLFNRLLSPASDLFNGDSDASLEVIALNYSGGTWTESGTHRKTFNSATLENYVNNSFKRGRSVLLTETDFVTSFQGLAFIFKMEGSEVFRMTVKFQPDASTDPSSQTKEGTELEFVIMVIAVSCVKLLSAHNSTQHTSRKHKV
jgi:hypothetical protein